MSKENDTIKLILNNLPNSRYHLNEFFESDAEVFSLGDEKLLFTIDEFSKEDLFLESNAFTLGRNLVIGTFTDLLASGGLPLMFGHSLTLDPGWNTEYIRDFSKGVSSALKDFNTGFVGGDTNQAANWRYTGVAIGKRFAEISRKGCQKGDLIYMSGRVGNGNLDAAFNLYSNNKLVRPFLVKMGMKLETRIEEAQLIWKYASACIDSSDGIFSSVENISEVNQTGYEIYNLPYSSIGKNICKIIGKPLPLLFLGECGEYELVFTLPESSEEVFLSEAKSKDLNFTCIGRICDKRCKTLKDKDKSIDLSKFNIRARDFEKVEDYLFNLTVLIEQQ